MTSRLLLTNDDGIDSPGMSRLATRLASSYEVVVAAPDSDKSGSGTGIGRFDPARGVDMTTVDMGDITAYQIAGPPGLAVMAAALGAFGRVPDLVVSGINAGVNTGHSIVHSGTVGGALTARTFRIKALAISLAQSDPWHWDTAVEVGVSAIAWMLGRKSPQVLNINVPAMPLDQVAGAHWADLDEFGYFRIANAEIAAKRLQFEVGPSSAGSDPGCDTALCEKGFITVTPLSTVEPAPFPDTHAAEIVGFPLPPRG